MPQPAAVAETETGVAAECIGPAQATPRRKQGDSLHQVCLTGTIGTDQHHRLAVKPQGQPIIIAKAGEIDHNQTAKRGSI